MNAPQQNLRHLLDTHFSREELRTLMFDLDIDHEIFPESGEKPVLVREFIKHCQTHNRLAELGQLLVKARPDVAWPDLSQPTGLGQLLGEPWELKHPFEPETVEIPAGLFLMGSPAGSNSATHELPLHEVSLPAFRLGRYPVTTAQYAEFVRQTKTSPPKKPRWLGLTPPRQLLDHPVTGVSWLEAQAYCRWLSEQTGRAYRLPTEAEWEKGARGVDGRTYPWGNEWQPTHCHFNASSTAPVASYPAGQSLYACWQMVGNVWEWTNTIWGTDWGTPQYRYPYRPDDGREQVEVLGQVNRVFRGAPFNDQPESYRCSARDRYAADGRDGRLGFRIALTI